MDGFNTPARGQLANFRIFYQGVTIVVAAHVDVVFIENPCDILYYNIVILLLLLLYDFGAMCATFGFLFGGACALYTRRGKHMQSLQPHV